MISGSCAEADDGEMAQTMITRQQPDVAVLDIQMPKASGIEVTRWVRANFPQVGVLILTAYDDDPYVLAVLQAGANGYVLKTASPVELIQAVRDVICRQIGVGSGYHPKTARPAQPTQGTAAGGAADGA